MYVPILLELLEVRPSAQFGGQFGFEVLLCLE